MNTHSDSHDILRRIDSLAAEADHTDDESRAALEDAGVEPAAFARSVREHAQTMLALDRLAGRGRALHEQRLQSYATRQQDEHALALFHSEADPRRRTLLAGGIA